MSDSVATPADFELGREALLEITPAETIGAPAGSIDEGDGVISVYFENTMLGYPGWRWTVSIAHVDGLEPSVLETELTPGDSALLSPDWVPWSDRLAEYKETQAGLAAAEGDIDADGIDDDDDDDFDDDDVNDDDDALLHSGDLDGVDIDSLEDDALEDDALDDDSDELDDDASALEVHVDEPDQAEAEPDDAGPEPQAVTGRKRRDKQEDSQGD